MKKYITTASLILLGGALAASAATNEWTNLLDPKLSQFDVWLGVPEPSVTGLPPGTSGKPLG